MIPDEIRKDVGKGGEEIASKFLMQRGYRIIERNYRKKWGEIDIITEKEGIVRFVEVKAVTTSHRGGFSREKDYWPEELVHKSKLRKIARTAALYMEERHDTREYQIDVVGVIMDQATHVAHCRLFEQVLEDNL